LRDVIKYAAVSFAELSDFCTSELNLPSSTNKNKKQAQTIPWTQVLCTDI